MEFMGMEGKRNCIEFENLIYEVKNKDKEINLKYARIIDGLSGRIESGKITAVMGASGCGKTHFFELLIGNLSRDCKTSGKILYNGQERDWKQWIRMMSFLPQDDIYYPDLTLYESIMYNLSFTSMSDKEKESLADESMQTSNIYHKKDAPIKTLSGGERKRAMIAITLVNKPELLILDEPTTGLDSNSALKIVSGLKSYAEKNNKIVVMTVHQPGQGLFNLFGDLIFLTKGGLFYMDAVSRLDEFFAENGIIQDSNLSQSEFLFQLHSNKHESEISMQYKEVVENIVRKNKNNASLPQPKSCNNNIIFFMDLNLKHVFILFKHNLRLMFKSDSCIRSLMPFIIIFSLSILSFVRGTFGKTQEKFKEISLDMKELNFGDCWAVAYSLFTNYFITDVIMFVTFFSINVQDQMIMSLEIFTRKYSILTYFVYNIFQKFTASSFFLNILFVFYAIKNRSNDIPFKIMIYLQLIIVLSNLLTTFAYVLVTSLPLGPKMSTFFVLCNNFFCYAIHPVYLGKFCKILENIGYIFTYIMDLYFIYPHFVLDLTSNILARTRYLKSTNESLVSIISYLKYSGGNGVLAAFEAYAIKTIPGYKDDTEHALTAFHYRPKYYNSPYLVVFSSFICLSLALLISRLVKSPNVRTRLQK